MTYRVTNIKSQEEFHNRVEDLRKVNDEDDRQLTTKLQGKQGNLEGRYVTLLKKLISLLPGIHLARTTPVEVAKAVGQFADDYSKKKFLTKNDQDTLVKILERLKTKGKASLKGKEVAIDEVIKKIQGLPTVGVLSNNKSTDKELKDVLDSEKASPLFYAILDKDIDKVNQLITQGADVNTPLGNGSLPLHFAAQVGDVASIKLLLTKMNDVNVKGNHGGTPLAFAAMGGKPAAVQELLNAKADANIADEDGYLPLHFAAGAGDVASIKLLLPITTNRANALGGYKLTPLFFAAGAGKVAAVQELLKEGADADLADGKGYLPLHVAADVGDVECIQFLLAKTTKGVNVKDTEGSTPLVFAAKAGKPKAVEALLNAKADVNMASKNGSLPLHYAAEAGDVESIKLLLPQTTKGVNSKGAFNSTPLCFAVNQKKVAAVVALLKEKADANIHSGEPDKLFPLHIAAGNGDLESIKLLLPETVGGLNVLDGDKATPLFYALQEGREDVVKYLMEEGANPNVKNTDGVTPLSIAKSRPELSEIVKILEKVYT